VSIFFRDADRRTPAMNVVKEIQRINAQELALGVDGSEKHSWHDEYRNSAYIFIGGLPYTVTEGDVLVAFSQYGEPSDIHLPRDRETKKSKGFCFLAYEDQRSTVLAVDNLNGIQLAGRTIRVDHVKDYKHKELEDATGKTREALRDRRKAEIKVLRKKIKKELKTKRREEKRSRRELREELRRKLAEEAGQIYIPKKKAKASSSSSDGSDSQKDSSDRSPSPERARVPAPHPRVRLTAVVGAFDDVPSKPAPMPRGSAPVRGAFDVLDDEGIAGPRGQTVSKDPDRHRRV
jgi:RNA-binding motif X-linked protein 2